ncbi:MAG TPA: hypothetical protein VKP11_11710, partial [Frankiaceae bacterium]|nr:hypothetical protein [Frankiaceae bacterium]
MTTLRDMTLVVVVVAVVVAVASYLTWLAARLDRLAMRVDAAQAGLDAQLVRRAAAAHALAHDRGLGELHRAAQAAIDAPPEDREAAENALSRALRAAVPDVEPAALGEVEVAATRVGLARQFYNDAVRDLRALRGRRVVRLLRLPGRAPL